MYYKEHCFNPPLEILTEFQPPENPLQKKRGAPSPPQEMRCGPGVLQVERQHQIAVESTERPPFIGTKRGDDQWWSQILRRWRVIFPTTHVLGSISSG